MRRVMILMVSVLAIVTMSVSPAFAGDWDNDGWDEDFGFWVLVPVFVAYDFDYDWDGHHRNHHGDHHRNHCEGPVCLID